MHHQIQTKFEYSDLKIPIKLYYAKQWLGDELKHHAEQTGPVA